MSHLGNKLKAKLEKYDMRKNRVNNKIKASNPDNRIVVTRSNMYIKAEIVDKNGNILACVSDKWLNWKTKSERAFAAWEALAKIISEKKLTKVVFDRNGYLYHGRVKALAEGIRKWGINL